MRTLDLEEIHLVPCSDPFIPDPSLPRPANLKRTRASATPWLAHALVLPALVILSACATGGAVWQEGAASTAQGTAAWAAVDSMLRSSYPADGPGATAIVVRDGEVVYRGAAGMANLELGVPMRPDMVMPIFSVSKQFTGVAILMLAEEGKLSLHDPVTRFLPDFPVQGRTLTVAHLLSHTGGLPNYTDDPEYMNTVRNHVSKDELIARFSGVPFDTEPGARWAYNNSGYVLLGAIIERASGMSYGDFLRTRILTPLGMTSTHVYDAPGALIPGRASGYTRDSESWRNAEYFSLTHGFAVGNLLTSVDDLARWNGAIERGELLSASGWERAFTSFTTNDGNSTRYSAGWFLGRLGALETAEHAGDFMGGRSMFLRVPRERLFVAILANSDPTPADPESLAMEIAARVLGVSPHPTAISMTAARLDEYVGRYEVEGGDVRAITRDDGRLYTQRTGGQRFEIYPIEEDLFYFPVNGATMRFSRENGRIIASTVIPRTGAAGPPARRVE